GHDARVARGRPEPASRVCDLVTVAEGRVARLGLAGEDDRIVRGYGLGGGRLTRDERVQRHVAVRRRGRAVGSAPGRRVGDDEVAAGLVAAVERGRDAVPY